MKSVTTRADSAELKHDLTQSFQRFITEQTAVIQKSLDRRQESLGKQSKEICQLREQDSRPKGAADTIKIALLLLISVIAVLAAVLK